MNNEFVNVVKIKEPINKFKRFSWPRLADDNKTPLGVDVVAKKQDIIKIVYKFFRVDGISMEELLQEVFLAVIHKNRTQSAHDPRKSSFGHYVYMVSNHVCVNLVHKKKRYDKEKDSLDSQCGDDDKRTNLDVIEDKGFLNSDDNSDISFENCRELEKFFRKNNKLELARYIRAISNGSKPEIIRQALSRGSKQYSTKMIRDLREQVREFAEQISF